MSQVSGIQTRKGEFLISYERKTVDSVDEKWRETEDNCIRIYVLHTGDVSAISGDWGTKSEGVVNSIWCQSRSTKKHIFNTHII